MEFSIATGPSFVVLIHKESPVEKPNQYTDTHTFTCSRRLTEARRREKSDAGCAHRSTGHPETRELRHEDRPRFGGFIDGLYRPPSRRRLGVSAMFLPSRQTLKLKPVSIAQ